MQPSCIVLPQSAEDVSSEMKSLVQLEDDDRTCQFAVRSGGHTSWAGASNIDFGAVIDLRSVNTIELAADKSTVSVGVGAVWGEVYKELEPHGLSVNGGRASTVGE
jgi:FAD/FMN-containing dehydrogenase